jgi:small subunit ribosomal protein S10
MKNIRIKIKGYDSRVVDNTVKQIVEDVLKTGAKVSGPVPLPNRRKLFCVLRGPHIDAKSKEHFQMITHTRLIEIVEANSKTIESLTHLQVPAGVSIEIK